MISRAILMASAAAAPAIFILGAAPAQAYIGPGAGLSAIGSLLALVAAVLVGIVGFLWYPMKRILKGRKAPAVEEEQPDETTGQGGRDA
jgi:hypothetical protein